MIKRKGNPMINYIRTFTRRDWLDVALGVAVLGGFIFMVTACFGVAELVWHPGQP